MLKGEKMYSRLTNSWFKHWDFILLDVICLQIAFTIAYFMRHGLVNPFALPLYRGEAMILLVCQLLVVLFSGAFSGVLRRGYYTEFVRTIKHVIVVMGVVLVVLFVTKDTGTYSRIVFVITGLLYVGISYVARSILKKIVRTYARENSQYSMVVVTTEKIADQVLDSLKKETYQQYIVKGVCLLENRKNLTEIQGHPVFDDEETLIDYVCHEWVDEVMFWLPAGMDVPEELQETLTTMGIVTHVPIHIKSIKGSKQFVEKIANQTMLTTSINIVGTKQLFYKRILDILGGTVGCLLTLVLMIFIGPIIYIKSPGPIFFSQIRIGKNGRKFKIYKFRSMYMDAEERKKELMKHNKMDGFMFKMDYDPRIIGSEKVGKDGKPKGIGNFIRATSIDEFPQFWNVLKGDMSLVGTRPPTLDEWEQYKPHHRARMSIKPGITGMWQVSGRSDITDFEEVVKLDTEYIESWNLGLDFKILFMTVLKVLKSDGAV